jgi:hypothetical protein
LRTSDCILKSQCQYSLQAVKCECSKTLYIYQLYLLQMPKGHFNEDSIQLLLQQLYVLRISLGAVHHSADSRPLACCHFLLRQAMSHQMTTLNRKLLAYDPLIFRRIDCLPSDLSRECFYPLTLCLQLIHSMPLFQLCSDVLKESSLVCNGLCPISRCLHCLSPLPSESHVDSIRLR